MDLLPPNIRAVLARYPLGSQSRRGMDAVVVVKYFFPAGRYTLFVTEAEFDDEDARLYGYCISPLGPDCDESGSPRSPSSRVSASAASRSNATWTSRSPRARSPKRSSATPRDAWRIPHPPTRKGESNRGHRP